MTLTTIQQISIWILPILFAITLHEVAHAYTAYYFGDYQVKAAGRLSLNPIKHIELMGTIIIPVTMLVLTGFALGWAKPVQVSLRHLRNAEKNMFWIALAGPMSNLLMAILWAILLRTTQAFNEGEIYFQFVILMAIAGMIINTLLMVLNLLPIPPLDGSKVIMPFLPNKIRFYFQKLEPYGFFVLIALMLLGLLGIILNPFINFSLGFLIDLSGVDPATFTGFIQSLK